MPDRERVLDHSLPAVTQRIQRNVRGRRAEPRTLQTCTHLLRAVPEVAGKLDFPVADGGNACECGFEVGFQGCAHCVELQADGFYFLLWTGCKYRTRNRQRAEEPQGITAQHRPFLQIGAADGTRRRRERAQPAPPSPAPSTHPANRELL